MCVSIQQQSRMRVCFTFAVDLPIPVTVNQCKCNGNLIWGQITAQAVANLAKIIWIEETRIPRGESVVQDL